MRDQFMYDHSQRPESVGYYNYNRYPNVRSAFEIRNEKLKRISSNMLGFSIFITILYSITIIFAIIVYNPQTEAKFAKCAPYFPVMKIFGYQMLFDNQRVLFMIQIILSVIVVMTSVIYFCFYCASKPGKRLGYKLWLIFLFVIVIVFNGFVLYFNYYSPCIDDTNFEYLYSVFGNNELVRKLVEWLKQRQDIGDLIKILDELNSSHRLTIRDSMSGYPLFYLETSAYNLLIGAVTFISSLCCLCI